MSRATQALLDLIEEHAHQGEAKTGWIAQRMHHAERRMLEKALDRVIVAERAWKHR